MMTEAIKLDINFLDKPLWLQSSHTKQRNQKWSQIDNFVYFNKYYAPSHVDMVLFLFILMKSQQNNYCTELTLSRYEILKGCHYPMNPQYLKRLEESLKRWQGLRLHFKDNFFDGSHILSKTFRPLESFQFVNQKLNIILSKDFLKTIKQSTYFKYIHLNYYTSLKRPISKRLFEIFSKNFKDSNHWLVNLVELGHQLSLYSRKKSNLNSQVLYPSDVLVSIKPAIKEINQVAKNIQLLEELKIDPKEILSVSYDIRGKDRHQISFKKRSLPNVYRQLTTIKPSPTPTQDTSVSLIELFDLLKSDKKKLRQIIQEFVDSKGFDYVKWNILYANRYSTGHYADYLTLCLKNDWAFEFREEQELLIQQQPQLAQDQIDLKAQIVRNIASKADYIILSRGRKYKIQKILPNGALEILREDSQMTFTVSPERAFNCRFENLPR